MQTIILKSVKNNAKVEESPHTMLYQFAYICSRKAVMYNEGLEKIAFFTVMFSTYPRRVGC